MGVSVITGLGSGDLSMGLSSSLSWWIHRSGGFRSLELPLYLWEPLEDLEAARFLWKEEEKKRRLRAWKKPTCREAERGSSLLLLVGRGAPRTQEGPHYHQNDGEGPHRDDDDDDQDVVLAGARFT